MTPGICRQITYHPTKTLLHTLKKHDLAIWFSLLVTLILTFLSHFWRLVHDRETGKPKGYGFIEYQDRATADSCVRNLNNVEYNGRPLRGGPAIGNEAAQNENIKALQQALGGMQQESPYGAAVEPNEAPEAISKVSFCLDHLILWIRCK